MLKLKRGEDMKKKNLLRQLFLTTLYLSTFTFGGGYVIVSLMKKKIVDEKHWIDQKEMLDLIAIAQSMPGAIAVNGAIVIGYKLVGLLGILVSLLGTILPPFLIISIISLAYSAFISNQLIHLLLEGMQIGVVMVIISVVYEMFIPLVEEKNFLKYILFVFTFVLNYFFNINIAYLILINIVIGSVIALIHKRDQL